MSSGHACFHRSCCSIGRAYATQRGKSSTPPGGVLDLPEVPMIAGRYETLHPDRIKKFPYRPRDLSIISMDGTDPQWRHELDHDTESLLWVLLDWVCRRAVRKRRKGTDQG